MNQKKKISSPWLRWTYPLVNIQKAIENGPVEIVDFPINSMVDLSSSLRKRLPEGISTKIPVFCWLNLYNHHIKPIKPY